MPNKREQPYSSEFKEASVKLAIESERPIAKTAEKLGVNRNTLHNWIRKYSKSTSKGTYMKENQDDEIRRLKKELVQVTQERDLLKKAAAYFAKESK